jgi:hypothetical protein
MWGRAILLVRMLMQFNLVYVYANSIFYGIE